MTAAFDPSLFQVSCCGGPLGREIRYVESCGSTNDLALADSHRHGLVVVADGQTGGRGRGEHRWEAPARSSILASVVVPPPEPIDAPHVPLVVAVAIGDGIASSLAGSGFEVQLKWPNDVLVGREKIAGILCESRVRGGRIVAMVVGFGVNVHTPRTQLLEGATSFAALGVSIAREALLGDLLERLNAAFAVYRREGFGAIRERFEQLSPLSRGVGMVVLESGIEGVSGGIADDGGLIVVASGGATVVRHGGVVFDLSGVPLGQG